MMIKIENFANNSQVLDRINQLLCDCNQKIDENYFILTPDNYTLSIEQSIAGYFGATLNVSVTNFRRLLFKLCDKDLMFLDKFNQKLIMSMSLSTQKNNLSVFSKIANRVEFADNMLDIVSNFYSSQITPNKIEVELSKFDGALKNKLCDIQLIMQEYSKQKGEKLDEFDSFALLCEYIRKSELIQNSTIIVAGFDSLSKGALSVLHSLIDSAKAFYYLESQSQNLVFNDAYTSVVLKDYLEENHIGYFVDQSLITNENAFLFEKKQISKQQNTQNYKFFVGTKKAQIQYVCEQTKKLLFEGEDAQNIGVCVCDLDGYSFDLKNELEKYQIPYFLDKKYILAKNVSADYLLSLLSYLQNPYSCDLIRAIKNPFFDMPRNLCEQFEIYIKKYSLTDYLLRETFDFCLENDEILLQNAEIVRQKISSELQLLNDISLDSILSFCQNLKSRTHIYAVENVGEQMHLYCEQSLDKMLQIVDQINQVLGKTYAKSKLVDLLKSSFLSTKISLAVATTACVLCGDALSFQFENKKHLFVLDANENVFPQLKQDCKLLTDYEILQLKRNNLHIFPLVSQENIREKLNIFRIFNNETKHFYLTCNVDENPSEVFLQLQQAYFDHWDILQKVPFESFSSQAIQKEFILKIASNCKNGNEEDSLVAGSLIHLSDSEFAKILQQNQQQLSLQPIARELFYSNNATSISALEKFFACPYQHFLSYGIRLQMIETSDILPIDIGNLLHLFCKKYVENSKSRTKKSVDKILDEIFEIKQYARLCRLPKSQMILSKIKNEARFVATQIDEQLIDYQNLDCEASFGKNDSKYPAVVFDDFGISLYGFIDRIDQVKGTKKVRLIDYKTGKGEFKYEDLYFGKKLQLPIYLFALSQSGYEPFEAYYMQLNSKFESMGKRKILSGFNSEQLQSKEKDDNDLRITSDEKGEIYEFNLKDLKNSTDLLANDEKITNIQRYALLMCKQAISKVLKGDIFANGTNCDYCPYHKQCKNANIHQAKPIKNPGDYICNFKINNS